MSLLLAIDPGKHGAFAWKRNDGSNALCWNLGDDPIVIQEQLQKLCQDVGMDRVAYLEDVTGYAGIPRPGSTQFAFGRNFGWIEASLAAYNFEVRRIRPQKWQKSLSLLTRKGEDKAAHKRRLCTIARESFPHLKGKVTLANADALLILRYALSV